MSFGPAYRVISQNEAVRILNEHDDAVLLDVRTPREFKEGHIPGAVNIPVETVATRPLESLPNPHTPLVLYCRSGVRSAAAGQMLVERGFEHLYDMGGIIDWKGSLVSGE